MSAHDKTCAAILRKAVADFKADTLSLSAVEHLIHRVENIAESLELVDAPTPEPQSIRADTEAHHA